ncbi:HlyD family type I secretion periplasmic adaptor subunit [Rhodopila globiformis]|uniref:Membrane fusion protein (MFP) family protein n=1 Tax=Rhodopila globiformis TaxID=1071 RepID=A0A2S6NJ64_RHOGL|nr:HlyD family type I secretion periplasmic adaptor subunit [Rhodopila globiformis]PPQ34744.1 secretion protein [Rhodopila globiformis]
MRLLPRPPSKAITTVRESRFDPTLPAILEYQSPSAAIVNLPMPRIARGLTLTVSSMIAVLFALSGVIRVDRVVTAQGVVVARSPMVVVQPLETSIVRSIDVHEGEVVHAGQVLARLDPTFAASDAGASAAQVSTYQAQVARLEAEMHNRPFTYKGRNPDMVLQAAVYANRQLAYHSKLEDYRQKFDSLQATIARARSDEAGYAERLRYAEALEQMRTELQRLNVGSRLDTLAAMDSRAEMQREMDNARETADGAMRDLAALVAERNEYIQGWHNDVSDKLTGVLRKLIEARDEFDKDRFRRQLVVMRAETDGTVMAISKVSVGSVLAAGQQFITLVPTDAPLEVEANIPADEDGYVSLGDPVEVKFQTFNYARYGMGRGVVRMISPDSFTGQDEQRDPTGDVPVPRSTTGDQWYYRSRITLDQIDLHGVPPHFHLSPGMPIQADIRIGRQTVLNYILGRFAPLATEGMREP